MKKEIITKCVMQYSPLSDENFKNFVGIAKDCITVKKYVHQRYSGIKSLNRLSPGYDIEKEVISTGLRKKLNLPSVYFKPALYIALTDIVMNWQSTKKKFSN